MHGTLPKNMQQRCFYSSQGLRRFVACGIVGLMVCFCAFDSPVIAQPPDGGNLFQATWVAKSPEDGTIIILLKRNGRRSSFGAKMPIGPSTRAPGLSTTKVLESPGKTAVTTNYSVKRWASQSISPAAKSSVASYSSSAQQVPKELLGQWARPPKKDDDMLPDRDQAKGFFGIWEIAAPSGKQYVFE